MLNLLSNAIKYTDDNGDIYVSLNKVNEDVVVSVKDSGVGIPNDKLELDKQMIFFLEDVKEVG